MGKTKAVPVEVPFGERLAQLREAAGLTRYRLAKDALLSAIHLARLEEGVSVPTWPVILRLADALGVGIADFRAKR
jgi:transcriptional regulator with XRE-family HTH domain